MRQRLEEDRIAEYRETGFLFPINALGRTEVRRCMAGYEGIAGALGGSPKAVQMSQIHRYYRWAWDLCRHPKVLDAVESVVGPDVMLWSAQVFAKRARDPGFVTMHQDGTYWGLDGGEVVTAWVALTESTVRNGCMRLLPGSHRQSILPHRDTYEEGNLLTRGQVVQAAYDEAEVVDVELQPGQMSLHHVRAIHGSHANSSDRPRVGVAIRYMTPGVRPERPGQVSVLVRGRDRFGNWTLQRDPPRFPSMESAVRAHQAEAERFVADLTRD